MSKLVPYPEDFDSITDNIYEAVMVIAKRARKISADQKLEIDKLIHPMEQEETSIEVEGEIARPPEERPVINFPKPAVLAFEELKKKEVEFQYLEKSGS
jgi:DNA-directed RNA polymerase subunit K/omega